MSLERTLRDKRFGASGTVFHEKHQTCQLSRAGEVCFGGQCVFISPFKGWKAMAHAPFRLSKAKASR